MSDSTFDKVLVDQFVWMRCSKFTGSVTYRVSDRPCIYCGNTESASGGGVRAFTEMKIDGVRYRCPDCYSSWVLTGFVGVKFTLCYAKRGGDV